MRLGRSDGSSQSVRMDQEQPFEVHLRALMREAAWRSLVLWTAGLWVLNAVMGLFVGYSAVIAFQPWVWLALLVLAAPFSILSGLSRGGAPERPWPHWVMWMLACCAVGIAAFLGCVAWLSWQRELIGQALRYLLLAMTVLPVALIVRKLAQLRAQSFSDKDTQ